MAKKSVLKYVMKSQKSTETKKINKMKKYSLPPDAKKENVALTKKENVVSNLIIQQ